MKPTLPTLALAACAISFFFFAIPNPALPDTPHLRPIRNPQSEIRNPPTLPLAIDTAPPAQPILGFGASSCWWAPEVGAWPDAQRREILRLLYDQKTGLALTIHRHNLGAGTLNDPFLDNDLRRTDSLLDPKTNRIDWTRDANATRIMREALAAGATGIILFVNSPPVTMTINGHGRPTTDPNAKKTADGKLDNKTIRYATNLAPERYADFATYLADITEHFLLVDKLPIIALSPINEPGHHWQTPKQEGCYYTPEQAAALLKKIVAEFKRRALPVRIEPTESESWKNAIPYYEALHRDPDLRAALTDLCVHSYGSNTADKRKVRDWLDKNWPDARLHMSEWCDMRGKASTMTMAGALPFARMIIEDFTLGRVHTWQYWRGAANLDSHDGLVYYDPNTRKATPNKVYWVIAQFSRHLPPGSRMIPLQTPAPPDHLLAMSALLPDNRLALVCANFTDTPAPLDIQFPPADHWRPRHRTLTDDTHNNTATPITDTLPPRSVVTLIFEKQ